MAESSTDHSSWMPSLWGAIDATNTEHDTKRKEQAAKKALVMLLDQSDQTNEVNLMPSLLKDTLSDLNQEQEQLKISRAKKKQSKRKKREQQVDLNSGGISALFDIYSSVRSTKSSGEDHLSSSGSSDPSSSSDSSSASTAVRSPGISSSTKATDVSSISSSSSYVAEFDAHESDSIINSTAERVTSLTVQSPGAAVMLSPTSPVTSIPSTTTTGTSPLTIPSNASAFPTTGNAGLLIPDIATTPSATLSKEAILLKIAQIKQKQQQDKDFFTNATQSLTTTQPDVYIKLAALHQQKSRKLVAAEISLLKALQVVQQQENALKLSIKHLQQQQQQQQQVASLNQLLVNGGMVVNAHGMANAATVSRPPKRQRLAATQQIQQAFFNNCPSMSVQTQNIMEYTLPITLPLVFKLGSFTTFAQLWCLVIVVGHTTETVFTNFGPGTQKYRISDETAPITPLTHHLIDCGWLHSFISTMFLCPLWFSSDSTIAFWMALALVQTLPIYLAVSFKSHYFIGQSKGEVDKTKSQSVELRLIDCFTHYEISTCFFLLYRQANILSWLGNGKWLLYLGVLAFNVAPLYLSWAYNKRYEQATKTDISPKVKQI